jgi:hypothetical protein
MKIRRLILLSLLAVALFGQAQLTTPVTISGTSAAVALPSGDAPLWVQFVAPSGNASNVRCGDSSVTSTRGMLIPAGAGQMLPPIGGGIRYNSLSTIFCYVATGDTLVVSWAK